MYCTLIKITEHLYKIISANINGFNSDSSKKSVTFYTTVYQNP